MFVGSATTWLAPSPAQKHYLPLKVYKMYAFTGTSVSSKAV